MNSIFNLLLRKIGFNSRLISARVIDDSGKLGPEYDHMSIFIEIDNRKYLADVGYGDLLIKPIEIKGGRQSDGRNDFTVRQLNELDFILAMCSDEVSFIEKYRFGLTEVPVEKFSDICLEKQTNPSSYFVKNLVCTKPTRYGRITLLNDKLIEKKGKARIEKLIHDDHELRQVFANYFEVTVS